MEHHSCWMSRRHWETQLSAPLGARPPTWAPRLIPPLRLSSLEASLAEDKPHAFLAFLSPLVEAERRPCCSEAPFHYRTKLCT